MNTTKFESKPPYLPVRFEYPESWEIVLSSGKDYRDITIIGPRNTEDTFSMAVVIRFTRLPFHGMDLKVVVEDTVARKSKLRNFELASRSDLEIAQHQAESIEFSYLSPKSHERINAGQMKVCEKRILFLVRDIQNEIIFSATEADYIKYGDIVNRIIQSMKFQ